jgi:FG-GAP-like repeat
MPFLPLLVAVKPVRPCVSGLKMLRNLAVIAVCVLANRMLPAQVSSVFYGEGGGVAVGNFNLTTADCSEHNFAPSPGSPGYAVNYALWQYCDKQYNLIHNTPLVFITFEPRPLNRVTRIGGLTGATGTSSSSSLTLDSSAPALPFLGNWLVGLSFVANAADPATATAAYRTVLRRQSNCSLDEDFIFPNGATPSADYITTLTDAQDNYHELSGLTTTPDTFPNGCNPQMLGLPASNSFELLGQTSDGAAISAQLASAGLSVTVTDLTANTIKNTQVTSGANPGAFYAASLRSNGIMDLVETGLTDPANSMPATAVLLGNGDGTFQKPVYYDVSANSYALAAGFTVDDVNGDGIPDIVILNGTVGAFNGTVVPVSGTVTTLIGKGDGTFTMGPVSNLTWTDSLQVVSGVFKTGDVKDLLVGGTVLLGSGNGSFTQGPTNNAIANLSVNTAASGGNAVGSLRNNGKLDVVVTDPGFVSIFYGNGDGTFNTGPSYAAVPDYMQVTITDIDGDGNPDIVLGTSSGGVYAAGGYDTPLPMFQILVGNGDGTFVDSSVYTQGTYKTDKNIASADFNGDGKADVLVFNTSATGGAGTLAMLPGNGTAALGTPVTSNLNIAPTMLVAAKMNHDTLADAVVAGSGNSGATLAVLTNQGNGTFASEQDYALAGSAVSLVVGDFNGDGIPDIAVGESGQGVFVFFGQANGTLGTPVQVDTSANPTGLAAGVLTSSSRSDLVVTDATTGSLHVYLGNANETFTTATAPTISGAQLNLAGLGDLNHDGKLDLIVAGFIPGTSPNPNISNIYTFLGNGDGTFQAANTLAIASNDTSVASMAVADFNKDGNPDIVVGNADDYTEVLLGNGDGTLVETALALGQRPTSLAAADLLGNGYPEILAGEGDTQGQGYSLAVFENQPTGWTAALATPTVTVSPSPASITTAQSTMVSVTVSGAAGSPTPTGTVTLTSGAYTSAATTLTSGSAVITVPGSSLAVATDTLTATYTPDTASSTVYNSATGTNTVTVTSAPAPGFTLSNGGNVSVVAGAASGNTSAIMVSPINGFTGTVDLSCAVTMAPAGATSPATCGVTNSVNVTAANPVNATLTVNTTTSTTAGTYAVTVTGTSGGITMQTNVNVTVSAYVAPSFALSNSGNISFEASATTGNTATITITPANGFTGAVNLSCAVTTTPTNPTSPATCAVTPSVTISGASAQIATLTVNTTTTTTAGSYAVTVTGVSGGISMPTTVDVAVSAYVAPSFTLTNGGAITISSPGASTGNTTTITVTPSGGFTGNVTLTAVVATSPTNAVDPPTFSFGATSPLDITGASAAMGTLTVSTTASTTGALISPVRSRWYATGATLAMLILFGIPARRRRWCGLLGMLVLLGLVAAGVASCGGSGGGGNSGSPGTTTGSYTVTVTGMSGSITQTTTVNLTVN